MILPDLDSLVWLLAGLALGVVLSMLGFALMAAADRGRLRRRQRARGAARRQLAAPPEKKRKIVPPAIPARRTEPLAATEPEAEQRPVAPPIIVADRPRPKRVELPPAPVPQPDLNVHALFEEAFTGVQPIAPIAATNGQSAPVPIAGDQAAAPAGGDASTLDVAKASPTAIIEAEAAGLESAPTPVRLEPIASAPAKSEPIVAAPVEPESVAPEKAANP